MKVTLLLNIGQPTLRIQPEEGEDNAPETLDWIGRLVSTLATKHYTCTAARVGDGYVDYVAGRHDGGTWPEEWAGGDELSAGLEDLQVALGQHLATEAGFKIEGATPAEVVPPVADQIQQDETPVDDKPGDTGDPGAGTGQEQDPATDAVTPEAGSGL